MPAGAGHADAVPQRGIRQLKVVYSREQPTTGAAPAAGRLDTDREGPGKRQSPASNAFVPSVAGLILAGEVIRDLAGCPRICKRETEEIS